MTRNEVRKMMLKSAVLAAPILAMILGLSSDPVRAGGGLVHEDIQ